MFSKPGEVIAFITTLILLLQNVSVEMARVQELGEEQELASETVVHVHSAVTQMQQIISCVLHDFQIGNAGMLLDEELGFWVKPRSTTWFSIFLCTEYDDFRWIQNFRITKKAMFQLAANLQPFIRKQDTKYRRAIPIRVRIVAAIYKLVHRAPLLIVSEFFAIGLSTVSMVLREVVNAINIVFKNEIKWPSREQATINMAEFKEWCSLPGVIGAIDATHFSISKPAQFSEDYYYFKTNGYSLVCQAVISWQKKFLDVYVGLPGSLNDARVLRRSGLFSRVQERNGLIDGLSISEEGFRPYLLGDKGYPLLPWILTPYREGRLTVLEELYNRKHKCGRSVVENTFGILKQSFRELGKKSELHVTFLPDVVVACCYLHNLLLGQETHEVERLLETLSIEGLGINQSIEDIEFDVQEDIQLLQAEAIRQDLGLYLGRQRNLI